MNKLFRGELVMCGLVAACACVMAFAQTSSAATGAAQDQTQIMKRIDDLLTASKAFFLATVDGDQPKLRPLGAHHLVGGKVWFGVGEFKNVYRQLAANPKCELVALQPNGGKWLRWTGRAVFAEGAERERLEEVFLSAAPGLRKIYDKTPGKRMMCFTLAESRAELIAMMPPGEVLLDERDDTVYQFSVKDRKGGDVSLKDYAGKVLLVVNTATRCGFTPQYKGLEAMYERLKGRGFELLDFPCNQFGKQAPGTDEEIHGFCVLNYKTTFPQFAKVEVNGANAAPLFRFLVANAAFKGFPQDGKLAPILEKMLGKADPNYASKPDVTWNFTKFLIGKDGRIVRRFEPTAPLAEVEEAIRTELAK